MWAQSRSCRPECRRRERVLGGELRSVADLREPVAARGDQRRLQPRAQRRAPGRRSRRSRRAPTAAIYTPPVGSTFRRVRRRPGAGLRLGRRGRNAFPTTSSTGCSPVLAASADTGTGPVVDFSPPATGFPLGNYTLTLKVTDSARQRGQRHAYVHDRRGRRQRRPDRRRGRAPVRDARSVLRQLTTWIR